MAGHYEIRVFRLILWIFLFVVTVALTVIVFLPLANEMFDTADRYPAGTWKRFRFYGTGILFGFGPLVVNAFWTLTRIIVFIRHEEDRDQMNRLD